jgi:transposase InsO family protein
MSGRQPRTGSGWPTYTRVRTWSGFVYVAFVIDAFSRSIVGWRVSHSCAQERRVLDRKIKLGCFPCAV